ncbi:hypothetical protein JAAARDRAFT_202329 [Jaapia argillacea MUCL 33604]|uniref:Cyclopropane-fatty-acyl-phospholipid synthase n=1 Tax=Jaapia argillacea MUCL 33604 TaxID=933084 RepID=A0A067QDS6_9AGAM|nr:hypothetical protein JAAARDRAFT_202329 [Jaapia argillacea MUCL 33604]
MGSSVSTMPSFPSSSIASSCISKPPPTSLLSRFTLLSPRAWFTSFARNSICSALQQVITIGYLEIDDTDGKTYCFGNYSDGCNDVTIKVVNDDFWSRVLLSNDLGVSEAYIFGEIHISSLKGLMDLWLDNEQGMASLSSSLASIASTFSSLFNAFFGQTKWRARANVIASYDQSNDLFKAFLSKEMMYSCALWGPEEGGVRGDLLNTETEPSDCSDLEAAQIRKIHYVLKRARARPGCRLLEFGSGWGGLSIIAARDYGCTVDTLTLSIEQKSLADERIRLAGLEDHITVHLMDYRDALDKKEWEKAFDAFVSVEMVEHVGTKHYKEYFRVIDYALKSSNAAAVVTASTFPESRYTGYQADDFMRRYMWPNSCLPSVKALTNAAQSASQGRFTLETVEDHSTHYPRTLRTWSRRLESSFSSLHPSLSRDFPSLALPQEYEAFKRKWRYFFEYAGAGFEKGWITCHMLVFVRERHWSVGCNFFAAKASVFRHECFSDEQGGPAILYPTS